MSSAFALSCYFMYLMFWYACRPVSSPFSYNYRIDIIVMSSACLCMLFSTVCTISPIIKYLIKRENCDTVMLWILGINIFQEEKTIFVGSDWFSGAWGHLFQFFHRGQEEFCEAHFMNGGWRSIRLRVNKKQTIATSHFGPSIIVWRRNILESIARHLIHNKEWIKIDDICLSLLEDIFSMVVKFWLLYCEAGTFNYMQLFLAWCSPV